MMHLMVIANWFKVQNILSIRYGHPIVLLENKVHSSLFKFTKNLYLKRFEKSLHDLDRIVRDATSRIRLHFRCNISKSSQYSTTSNLLLIKSISKLILYALMHSLHRNIDALKKTFIERTIIRRLSCVLEIKTLKE